MAAARGLWWWGGGGRREGTFERGLGRTGQVGTVYGVACLLSTVEVPQIQFLKDGVFQFLDKVVFRPRLCNDRFVVSWVQYIDKVVDVPVVMQRSSLQGASMKAFGITSHIFFVLALFPFGSPGILRAPCIWQPLVLVCCDSQRKLLDEFLTFS